MDYDKVKKRDKIGKGNLTLLIVLGGGGHTQQMLKLVDELDKKGKFNYEYVISSDDTISTRRIKHKGRVFRILNPRKMTDKNFFLVFLKFIPSSFQALSVLFRSKATGVLSCGPALSIHLSLLGKLFFRKKIIFLESWSRVYSKSLAGKFTYGISDLFFVQWEQEKKNYPKAVYAGRLG